MLLLFVKNKTLKIFDQRFWLFLFCFVRIRCVKQRSRSCWVGCNRAKKLKSLISFSESSKSRLETLVTRLASPSFRQVEIRHVHVSAMENNVESDKSVYGFCFRCRFISWEFGNPPIYQTRSHLIEFCFAVNH